MLLWSSPFKAEGRDGHGGPWPAGEGHKWAEALGSFLWDVFSRGGHLPCEKSRKDPEAQSTVCVRGPQSLGFPGDLEGKEPTCSAGDLGSVPGLGRSPGEGNAYSLWHSCLENSRDRGAWRATVWDRKESDMTERPSQPVHGLLGAGLNVRRWTAGSPDTTSSPTSMKKLSSTKLVPGAKRLGTSGLYDLEGQGIREGFPQNTHVYIHTYSPRLPFPIDTPSSALLFITQKDPSLNCKYPERNDSFRCVSSDHTFKGITSKLTIAPSKD